MDALTALLEHWRPDDPAFLGRAAAVSVNDLEYRYGVTLPDDFRRYLLDAALAEDLYDDHETNWWAVHRIRNIPNEYEWSIGNEAIAQEAERFLFFADFLIWSWAWAICCSDGPNRGKVALIGGDPDWFVADSFAQFVELYLKEPASVW